MNATCIRIIRGLRERNVGCALVGERASERRLPSKPRISQIIAARIASDSNPGTLEAKHLTGSVIAVGGIKRGNREAREKAWSKVLEYLLLFIHDPKKKDTYPLPGTFQSGQKVFTEEARRHSAVIDQLGSVGALQRYWRDDKRSLHVPESTRN